MADWLRVAIVVLGAGVVAYLLVLARRRQTLAGDMEAPMDLERHRAKSEAEMAKDEPLSEADAAAAAPLVAFVEKIGTGEQPIVHVVRKRHGYRQPVRWQRVAMRRRQLRGFAMDPLGATIPSPHRVEQPVLWFDAAVDWFAPALPATPASMPFPELPAEPAPVGRSRTSLPWFNSATATGVRSRDGATRRAGAASRASSGA